MVNTTEPWIKASGVKLWSGHCVVFLGTQGDKWVPANCQPGNLTKCWEVTCDGLASHPGGVAILIVI